MNRLLAIFIACVAAVAAGCGSGDEEAPTTTTTSTTAATAEEPQPGDQEPFPRAERPGENQRAPGAADEPEANRPGSAQAGSAPSEQDFLAAADAICADLNAAAGDPPTATLAQIELAARDSQELVATGLERLGALEPAPGLEVIFGQFTDAVADQQEIVAQLADAAAAGDVARVQAVALEVDAASARKNEIAVAAGLDECGSMR